MTVSPLAGKPAPLDLLVDVAALVTAYYAERPDPEVPAQRVRFGTSGHRGTSFSRSFNEDHVLAIAQAICAYRLGRGIRGPLFLGIDTHALSVPARASVLEVLAANGVEVRIACGDAYTPTPVISHAILAYNRGRKAGFADGIVLTPSHNPPEYGGCKYNPPNGGPAETVVTAWIETRANAFLEHRLAGVKRVPADCALRASTTKRHDFITAYVEDLAQVVDLAVIRDAKLRLGVDPLGGAGVHYWGRIAERYGLDLTVVDDVVDPTFRFMTVDWDGRIRMDPSSPYALGRIVGLKDRFDLSFACDTDHDRHGLVTPVEGLLPPNHALCSAIAYLFGHRPLWSPGAAVGKTMVSSALIDRVVGQLGRRLYEVPVGFKWFVDGLLDGSLAFAGEESAGATVARLDGRVWTTDKDGLVPCLLAAEMTARTGINPAERYRTLTAQLGTSYYERHDLPMTGAARVRLTEVEPAELTRTDLGGEPITRVLTTAPGNGAALGGIKVETAQGWFAARPSGTEALCKLYAESFVGPEHLRRILDEARGMVDAILAAGPTRFEPDVAPHQSTEAEAVAAWENEGDPN